MLYSILLILYALCSCFTHVAHTLRTSLYSYFTLTLLILYSYFRGLRQTGHMDELLLLYSYFTHTLLILDSYRAYG